MVLLKLAARNVLRNKRRSGITFIGIGMGLTMVIIFYGVIGGMDEQITDNFIRAQAGHLQIYAEGYGKKARLLSLDERLEEPEALSEKAEEVQGVSSVAQRIRFGALIGTRRESLRVIGLAIQPAEEAEMGTLADSMVEGGYLNTEPGYALLGKQLAQDLGLEVEETLIVVANTASGAMNAIDVEIKGIFYTGYAQFDRSILVVNLHDGQKLLDIPGEATELAVMLQDIDQTDAVAERLSETLDGEPVEVQTWKETGAAMWQVLQLRRWILGVISIVVIVIAALGIVNTMLMSVFERVREIGTMMALGTTPREILGLFLAESALIGAAGGLLGAALGGSVVKVFSVMGIHPPGSVGNVLDLPLGTTIYANFSWGTLLMFFGLALLVAMLSALYPALLASRQEPVEALRHV